MATIIWLLCLSHDNSHGCQSFWLFLKFCLKFQIADEKNYGKSLFSRFQKLYLGKTGSPISRINIQHRMHPEIMKWPNHYFYNNRLHAAASKTPDNFPIVPFKMLSYAPLLVESDNIMLIIDVLVGHIDAKNHSIGILCTSPKQKLVMQNKLKLKWFPFFFKFSCTSSLTVSFLQRRWCTDDKYKLCRRIPFAWNGRGDYLD